MITKENKYKFISDCDIRSITLGLIKREFACIYNVAVSANQQKNAVADAAGNTEKPEVRSKDEISLIFSLEIV